MYDEAYGQDTKIEVCCTAHTQPSVRRLVKSVVRGLKAWQDPEKALEGMGGTYFFSNEMGRKVAIMKPCDEEPLAPNNPKGYVGRNLGDPGWKPTVRVGEAAMREVAAYLLDRDGFAKVPTTALVQARHPIFCYNDRQVAQRPAASGLLSSGPSGEEQDPSTTDQLPMKQGSLQEFVTHMCDTSEMGPSKFSTADVHRIGILDVRLFNTDRHAGNMLVRSKRNPSMAHLDMFLGSSILGGDTQYELIPIDHGFCLPETLEACYFEWMHWPQAMLPFSDEELMYIRQIDIEADKDLLRRELPGLRPESLRVMEMATTLLKQGAEAGMTLFEIASVMTRPFDHGDEEPSELEKTAAFAKKALEMELEAIECDSVILEDDSEGDACGVSDCEGSPTSRPAIAKQPSLAEDNLMFEPDWDEEGAPPRTPVHASRLQATGSLGSSISSVEDFSIGLTASVLASSGSPHGSPHGTPDGSLTPEGMPCTRAGHQDSPFAMPSSIHVTGGGYFWQRMKGTRGNSSIVKRPSHPHKRTTPGMGTHKARMCCASSYPPAVLAFSPESLSVLFKDMEEPQWKQYMAIWADAVDAALHSGQWKQSRGKDAPVAHSCPRF